MTLKSDLKTGCRFPGKIAYPTEGKAIKAMQKMPRHLATGNMPYSCIGHWHIGRFAKK